MKSSNQNKIYLISAMLLSLTVMVSVHAQDTKSKKEIRITILQDGKVKQDTSFEVKRNIQKEELNAMVEAFQKKSDKNKNFLPRWRHRDEAFMFPFNKMPNLQLLDSLLKNNKNEFGFSMKFDNDSVFEKYFRGFGPDSVYTYKWNDDKTPCPCQNELSDIDLINPSNLDIFEIIEDEDVTTNPSQKEIIIEKVVPSDADNKQEQYYYKIL